MQRFRHRVQSFRGSKVCLLQRLAERLRSLLDPEGLGEVHGNRLFQFLAGLLFDCSSSSGRGGSSSNIERFECRAQCSTNDGCSGSSKCCCRHQLAAATKELQRLGLRNAAAECRKTLTADESAHLQEVGVSAAPAAATAITSVFAASALIVNAAPQAALQPPNYPWCFRR